VIRQRRAIVTGSSGFLGVSLIEELARRGWAVTGVDLRPPPTALPLGVQWYAGDVCEPGILEGAAAGADVAFHLAARITLKGDDDGQARRVNVRGVERLIDVARKGQVGRLVYCSTHRLVASGDWPTTAYERTKAEGLALIESAAARGLEACMVGPGVLLGPADYGPSPMGRFLVSLWQGDVHAIVTGRQYWVDVRDVARALLWAGVDGVPGNRYSVSGTELSLRRLAAMAAQCGTHRPPAVVVPRPLARYALPMVRLWIRTDAPVTRDSLASLRPYRRRALARVTEVPIPVTRLERTLADAHSFFVQTRTSVPPTTAAQLGRERSTQLDCVIGGPS
jgi:nucleoside-diphosphate-sugar epimerase